MKEMKKYLDDLDRQRDDLTKNLEYFGCSNDNEIFNTLIPQLLEVNNGMTVQVGKLILSEASDTTITITGLKKVPRLLLLSNYLGICKGEPENITFTEDKPAETITLICITRDTLFTTKEYQYKYFMYCRSLQGISPVSNHGMVLNNKQTTITEVDDLYNITFNISNWVNASSTKIPFHPYLNAGEFIWHALYDESEYFNIDDNGEVSLKPEYRGKGTNAYANSISDNGEGVVGSLNNQLPDILHIPNSIWNKEVKSVADGIFYDNQSVKKVILPQSITIIPTAFAQNSQNFIGCYGTKNVTSIGDNAFDTTHLIRADFPSLTSLGTNTFKKCLYLEYVNMGQITNIPDETFKNNQNLQKIIGLSNVTTIGKGAFLRTTALESTDLDLMNTVVNIDDMAFNMSNYTYKTTNDKSWYDVPDTGKTLGFLPTPKQLFPNISDINLATITKPNINPLSLKFNQSDTRWATRNFGNINYANDQERIDNPSWTIRELTYSGSCALLSLCGAYCGFYHQNETISSAIQLETIIKTDKGNNVFDDYVQQTNKYYQWNDYHSIEKIKFVHYMAQQLGLSIEEHYDYSAADIQALYNALSNGNYVLLWVTGGIGRTMGHVVLAYGITRDKEILIADTQGGYYAFDGYENEIPLATYKLKMENMCPNGKRNDDTVSYHNYYKQDDIWKINPLYETEILSGIHPIFMIVSKS